MHEFSLARNIVDIATEQVQSHGANKVESIEIEVGTLSGVVMDALEFAMEEAVKNSVLAGAKIHYQEIQARASCSNCDKVFELDDFFSICPHCQAPDYKITHGKELKVKSLRLDS